jgi:heat shock protein HslJ
MNSVIGKSVTLLLSALLCAGCGPAPDAPLPVPEPDPVAAGASAGAEASAIDSGLAELVAGESWSLSDASIEALRAKAADAGIFIEVQESRLVGYAGCNRFSASMQREGADGLRLEAPVASKRGCAEDALNAAERAFLDALPRLQRFRLADARLRLEGADGLWLEFVSGRPGASTATDGQE